MKLRTEIIDGELTHTPKGVYHDAMLAHALMQVLNEHIANWLSCPEDSPDMVSTWIVNRADEIMAEWGYSE